MALLRSTNANKLRDVRLDEKESVTIGRHTGCDVTLQDPRCSTRHCTVTRKVTEGVEMFWIEDLSTNGTYINKALLGKGKACELKPGDEIELLRAQSVGEDEHLAYVFEFTTPKRRSAGEVSDLVKKPRLADMQALCHICKEVIRHCVTLVPCLHNVSSSQFCDACYEACRATLQCPLCRKAVTKSHKNPEIDARISELVGLSQSFNSLGSAEEVSTEQGSSRLVHSTKLMYPGCAQCKGVKDGFQCQPSQEHVLCHTCKAAMPKRVGEAQQCTACEAYFCNHYLRGSTCAGIQPLQTYVHTTFRALLPTALHENLVEQTVLQDFLRLNSRSVENLAEDLVKTLDEQAWRVSLGSKPPLTLSRDSYVCADCAAELWDQLLLRYRQQIDPQLPEYLTAREKCRYGIQCRTQRHNISHAQKFNHVV